MINSIATVAATFAQEHIVVTATLHLCKITNDDSKVANEVSQIASHASKQNLLLASTCHKQFLVKWINSKAKPISPSNPLI